MNETILYFEDKVLLCKPGWPQTLHPSASSFLRDGTSFVYHHAQLDCFFEDNHMVSTGNSKAAQFPDPLSSYPQELHPEVLDSHLL